MSAHAPQGVDQAGHGGTLPVPRLPQVEDGLGRAGLGREEGDVPVDPQPLRQQPPVIVVRVGRIQQRSEAVLRRHWDPEGSLQWG